MDLTNISTIIPIVSVIVSIAALIISWMTFHSQNKSSQELNKVLYTMSVQDERKRLYAFIYFIYEQCKSGDDVLHSFRYKNYDNVKLQNFSDFDKRPGLAFICITYDFGFDGFNRWTNFEVAQFLNFYKQSKSDLELFRLYFPDCNDWYTLGKQYLDVLFSLYNAYGFIKHLGECEDHYKKTQSSGTKQVIESTKHKIESLNIHMKWNDLWLVFDKCNTDINLDLLQSYIKAKSKKRKSGK